MHAPSTLSSGGTTEGRGGDARHAGNAGTPLHKCFAIQIVSIEIGDRYMQCNDLKTGHLTFLSKGGGGEGRGELSKTNCTNMPMSEYKRATYLEGF